MASMPDLAPFLRKPRLGPTQKVRPVMKLEWDKLLAEATEKDVELKKDVLDESIYYDDDSDMERDCELDDRSSEEHLDERPMNLSSKLHNFPTSGTQVSSAIGVLDLSAKKKNLEVKIKESGETKKRNSSSFSNFQFNQDSPNDKSSKDVNRSDSLETNEFSTENKENYLDRDIKNIYSTPSYNKPSMHEENGKQFDSSKKYKGKDIHCKQSAVFFSEKKTILKNSHGEKDKGSKEEPNKKFDLIKVKKVQSEVHEKVKSNLEKHPQAKSLHVTTPIPQKFAVPATPKLKDSSRLLIINKKSYQILAPLGKGGSSKVYLVLNSENELLAVKCVRLSDVSESTKNDYLNEIQHLMKMQHCKHVIKLYDHQYLSSQKLLFAVMERGETDLSRFLKDKASSDEGISPELIMYYWTEMLMAVKSIHDNNIIHRDLKPANFLLVSGRLKLIDFGIASSIQTEQTSILMESQSGTFNYMSPEALQDLGFDNKIVLKIGRKTDVWSLGCILYYFLYKKTPYQDLVKPLHKLKAITDPNYVITFPKISGVPDILIESCKRCLIHDTKKRASVEELLAFRNRPLFSLSQVLGKLAGLLSPEEYKKAEKAFENAYENQN